MTKHIFVLPIFAAFLLLFSGCGSTSSTSDQQTQSGTSTTATESAITESQTLDNSSDLISEVGAKKIALDHANIPEDEASFLRVELDRENGRNVYDIEFHSGTTEYDYEIYASTGDIVSYDSDVEGYAISGNTDTAPASDTQIPLDEAKAIALKDAGLTEADVSFTETEMERDDGTMQYQISFIAGQTEYEYEIDANNGSIIGKDVEKE